MELLLFNGYRAFLKKNYGGRVISYELFLYHQKNDVVRKRTEPLYGKI